MYTVQGIHYYQYFKKLGIGFREHIQYEKEYLKFEFSLKRKAKKLFRECILLFFRNCY